MATTEEQVKVTIDISDVIIKRAAEVKEAEKAEKLKIAALKRETAAAAKEDKEAFANTVKMVKAREAEEEKAAKYIAGLKAKYFAEEQKAAEAAERAAERAAKGPSEWTLALKANTEANATLKGAINQNAEALGKLGAAASAVSPELGAIVMGGQKIAGVLSAGTTAAAGLGTSLGVVAAVAGPLALVVGGLALAWSEYEAEVQAATEAQERLNVAIEGVDDIARTSREEIDKLRVNIGQLSQEEYDDAQIRVRFQSQLEKGTAKLREEETALLATREDTTEGYARQNEALATVRKSLEQAATLNEQGLQAALTNAELARERAESEAVLADRLKDRSAAQKDANVTSQDAVKIERELAELTNQRVSALDFEYNVWLRDEQAAADARKQAIEGAEIEKDLAKEQADRELEAAARQVKLRDEDAARQEEGRQAAAEGVATAADTAAKVANSISSVLDDVYASHVDNASALQEDYEKALEEGDEAQAKVLNSQIEAEQDAAMRVFKANKALAITTASLSAIEAVAKAVASAPPPFNIPAVVTATAMSGAQIVAAAAQKPPEFDDTPQVMQATGAGRTSAGFKGGDFVAAAQSLPALKEQVDRTTGGGRRRTADRMNELLVGRSNTRDLRLVMGRV